MDVGEIERLREAVGLFNRGYYFEAHDAFEDLWAGERGTDRDFLQGLVHLAVGMYHFNTWNFEGARSQLEKALAALAPFGGAHLGLELDSTREAVQACLDAAPPGVEKPDFTGLKPPRIGVV